MPFVMVSGGIFLSDLDLNMTTLLRWICWVSQGFDLGATAEEVEENRRSEFFGALTRFQGILQRAGRPVVTRQAIRLWRTGTIPKRAAALEFLHQYLLWSKGQKERSEPWSEDRLEAFGRVESFLTEALLLEDGGDPNQGMPPRLGSLDPLVATALQGLMRVSNRSPYSESAAFFRGSRTEEDGDQSYYLLYRHSTNYGDVIKSFLVIQRPVKNVRSIHIFNHFFWGEPNRNQMSPIFREGEGFILKLHKSFYLWGFNYTVPADKRREPEVYRKQRILARWSPNGMGVIAIEYDDVDASPGLFGGLTMTLAGVAQPAVARVAMLHLGTRQSLGRDIMDNLVGPRELKPDDLARDLFITERDLKEAGCHRFGLVLDEYSSRVEWEGKESKSLADQILGMIDNTPAWEVTQSKGRSRGRRLLAARGAIETYGSSRPRD